MAGKIVHQELDMTRVYTRFTHADSEEDKYHKHGRSMYSIPIVLNREVKRSLALLKP